MNSSHHFPLRRWLVLNIFIFFFCTLDGQNAFASKQLQITTSPLSRLIRQPTIIAIYKEYEGPLWVGTQYGLYRFDGAKLTRFSSEGTNSTRLPASDITGIGGSHQSGVFVSTFGGGLLEWNRSSQRFEEVTQAEVSNEKFITHLFTSRSGRIWLGTGSGIFLYDPKRLRSSSWLRKHNLANTIGQPNAIAEDQNGNIFVASNTGLYKISERLQSIEKVYFSNRSLPLDTRITTLEFDASGLLFYGTNTGIVVSFDLASGLAISQKKVDKNTSSSISDLLFYKDRLWIGTDNGLSFSDKDLSLI